MNNKYQEAYLKLLSTFNAMQLGIYEHNTLEIVEVFNVIQELVDEKTPMKPIVYNINQFKCPKCLKQIKGKKMIYNMETKRFDIKSKIKVEKVYCPYCSQKLDWSGTDE